MKSIYSASLSFILMACAACSSEDSAVINNIDNPDAKQVVTLRVSSARSRAGRELLSSAPGQAIENVKVIVTHQDTVVWTKLLTQWCSSDPNASVQSTDTQTGREAVIEIPKDECRLITDEQYNFYAFGFSNNSDYDLTAINDAKVSTDKDHPAFFYANTPISLRQGVGEEIFAGAAKATGAYQGVDITIELSRQVAGTFGYLTKIPYVEVFGHKGRYLKLVASNPQKSFIAGLFDNSNLSPAATTYSVIHTGAPLEQNVIYTIDLLDWFESISIGLNEDGLPNQLIATGSNWKGNPECYAPGSVFGGSFMLPFAKTEATTLRLLLTSENGTVLRTWNVTLPEDSKQLSEFDVWSNISDQWTSVKATDDMLCYNVLRNHLYGIGLKSALVRPGDPNDPDNPGDPDNPDVPTPINNKQELLIQVNHNWGAIYNMGVE